MPLFLPIISVFIAAHFFLLRYFSFNTLLLVTHKLYTCEPFFAFISFSFFMFRGCFAATKLTTFIFSFQLPFSWYVLNSDGVCFAENARPRDARCLRCRILKSTNYTQYATVCGVCRNHEKIEMVYTANIYIYIYRQAAK